MFIEDLPLFNSDVRRHLTYANHTLYLSPLGCEKTHQLPQSDLIGKDIDQSNEELRRKTDLIY